MYNDNQENRFTIHEFSDQIKYDYINKELRSRGFEFGFMNSTLNLIPSEIDTAIRNNYFKVKCSKLSKEPAIVARVVQGAMQNWSVIAVVSQIKDDGGRLLEVNRYFIAEGGDNLWKIIDYLEFSRNNKGKYPIFDPESKIPKEGYKYKLQIDTEAPLLTITQQDLDYFLIDKGLIKFENNRYNLQEINYIARYVANNQFYAWAYNVSYLEQPYSFNLIIASDDSAYQDMYHTLSTPQLTPTPFVNYNFDESAVKTAMKELISNSFASRHLRTISDAINDTLITTDNWHQIFNTERANRAISEQLKGDRMARLLTLRAIIIPEMLGELLQWLQIEGNDKNWDDCLQFCKSFYNSQDLKPEARGIINDNLKKGVYNLLPSLLNQEIKPEDFAELLTNRDSAWKYAKSDLIKDIEKDLDLIGKNTAILDNQSLACGEKIWQKLIEDRKEDQTLPWRDAVMKNRNRKIYTIEFYQPFTDLFNNLEEWILYAYFSQVSGAFVPLSKEDFRNLFAQNSLAPSYNLMLYRQISPQEKLFKKIKNFLNSTQQIPLWFFLLWFFLPLSIGLVLGEFIKPLNLIGIIGSNDNNQQTEGNQTQAQKNAKTNNALQEENFNTTRKAIDKLVNDVITETGKKDAEVKAKLGEILGFDNSENSQNKIDISTAINEKLNDLAHTKKEQYKLMEAIKKYEEDNKAELKIIADRLIIENDPTFKSLKTKLTDKVKGLPSPPN